MAYKLDSNKKNAVAFVDCSYVTDIWGCRNCEFALFRGAGFRTSKFGDKTERLPARRCRTAGQKLGF
jgi:hypothetical protein